MACTAPGNGRCRDERIALQDPFHPSEVLAGAVDFAPLSEQDDDLGARLAFEMDVGRRTDVTPPAVFGRGQAVQDVGRLVTVEEGHDPERVGVGVRQRAIRQLLADQRPDRIGPGRTVPFLDPAIEEPEQGGLEGDTEAHDLGAHGPDPDAGPRASAAENAGGVGANPISS